MTTITHPGQLPPGTDEIWRHFLALSQLPRPSGKEQQVADYIIGLAQQHGLPWRQDPAGNLLINVPAKQRSHSAAVAIQNHMDMVTVKRDDSAHDFDRDPLQLQLQQHWLSAQGTTLGADNGLGCAAALALITQPGLQHPPLELLFTVEEETGLFGATAVQHDMLTACRMLNLDTEDWGELFIGCAGAQSWEFFGSYPMTAAPPDYVALQLEIGGLAGGHSGIQIHQQLGNAIKLLAHCLHSAQALGVCLAEVNAGVAHNVIPRRAQAVMLVPRSQLQALQHVITALQQQYLGWLPAADAGLQIAVSVCEQPQQVLTHEALRRLLALLLLCPHGALAYNLQQPAELVDVSANLARLQLQQGELRVQSSVRYFNLQQAQPVLAACLAAAEQAGLAVRELVNYPGWQPDFDSHLLAHVQGCYQGLYGTAAAVKAIHAGLECGILKSKWPGMDIVSFGPTIRGAHSPTERVDCRTVLPFWQLLTNVLATL